MPLIQSKSKKALQKNIETEMDANPGKEKRSQNLAIAYSIQRKNQRKKMAEGGMVPRNEHGEHLHDSECMNEGGMCKYEQGGTVQPAPNPSPSPSANLPDPNSQTAKAFKSIRSAFGSAYAKGGEVSKEETISEAIRRKKREKMMAEGGMVDLDSDENVNEYEELNEDAALKENYDDEELGPQPEDSNEQGDDIEEEDKHDMVSQIRKKMRSKRGT